VAGDTRAIKKRKIPRTETETWKKENWRRNIRDTLLGREDIVGKKMMGFHRVGARWADLRRRFLRLGLL